MVCAEANCDSSSGCGQNRVVGGWPRSPGRPSATRLIDGRGVGAVRTAYARTWASPRRREGDFRKVVNPCATWSAPVAAGGCCRSTLGRGRRSTAGFANWRGGFCSRPSKTWLRCWIVSGPGARRAGDRQPVGQGSAINNKRLRRWKKRRTQAHNALDADGRLLWSN